MKKTRLLTLLGSIGLILVLAVVACVGPAGEPGAPAEPGEPAPGAPAEPGEPAPGAPAEPEEPAPAPVEEWVVGVAQDAVTAEVDPLNPARSYGLIVTWYMVFDTLFSWEGTINPDDGTMSWKAIGQLAESDEWVNPLLWRVHLREGVKFHDGQELTAEDVKYTVDFIKSEPRVFQNRYWNSVAEVKIIDRYTLDFVLSEPDPLMRGRQQSTYIVPKSRGWTEASIKAFQENPVGTGPYTLLEFEVGKPARLQAFEGYRAGVPSPKFVTLRHIPEPTTRTAALLAGEVDIIATPPLAQLPLIEASPDLAVMTLKGVQRVWYAFQWLKPPFNDIRVRQALNYAVDRFAIVDEILEGQGMVATSLLWPGLVGGNIDREPYAYDPEKAKQLLAEAGYPDGFEFTFQTTSGEYIKDIEIAQVVQSYLADVGVTMNIFVTEMAKLWEYQLAGDYDMTETFWTVLPQAPEAPLHWALYSMYPEDAVSGGVLPEGIAEMRALKEKARKTYDPEEREQLYTQLNTMFYDFASEIFVHIEDMHYAYNKARLGELTLVFPNTPAWTQYWDWRSLYPAT